MQTTSSAIEVVPGQEARWRFVEGQRKVLMSGRGEYLSAEKKIFPGDQSLFPKEIWLIHVPAGAPVQKGSIIMQWTIYLDNARASSGEIDVGDYFEQHLAGT